MPSTTADELECKLKVDPSITVEMMQAVVEGYLMEEGIMKFQKIIEMISAGQTTWTTRPKVSLFRNKCL